MRPGGTGKPKSPTRRKSKFVFQDLHETQDRRVASQTSDIIKACVPQQLKAFCSAKSLQFGAMTWMTWDPSVTHEESVALGGWATPSNADW